ncbi:MAG: hypothetical protein GX102_15380 [Porphyromonadaceae bacterium]|jgi:hypothetical protein|nr:hypothetical protein [Porphyromonadaceae bacterium]
MARRTNKKIDFQKVALNTLTVGATGVAAHVIAEAIDLQKPEYADYGMLAAGIILPEVIKSPTVETAGNALLAVGAYRLAERNNIAGKLGFNTVPATAGLPGRYTIGSPWASAREVYANAPDEKKNSATATVQ